MTEVAMQTPNRYEVRSRKTLTRLLDAAEEVFVRDGYEAAQLDEIATRAERSKGAVYMHFKSKDDLFLGLIEHRIRSYIDSFARHMQECTTRQEMIDAFREFYIALLRDRAYHVLTLEFKLFALRHPEWKERYQKTFASLKEPHDEIASAQLYGKLSRTEKANFDASRAALGPIMNSLVLESYFEPDVLSEKFLRHILKRIFDALIPDS
jgi:AcrR family transcriptional regulator